MLRQTQRHIHTNLPQFLTLLHWTLSHAQHTCTLLRHALKHWFYRPPCSTTQRADIPPPRLHRPPPLAGRLRCWQHLRPMRHLHGDVMEAALMLLLMLLPGACILAARRGNRSHRFTISSREDRDRGGWVCSTCIAKHTAAHICASLKPLWVLGVGFHCIRECYLHVRAFMCVSVE